jgi:hypothetical protein
MLIDKISNKIEINSCCHDSRNSCCNNRYTKQCNQYNHQSGQCSYQHGEYNNNQLMKIERILEELGHKDKDGKYTLHANLLEDKSMKFGNTTHADINAQDMKCNTLNANGTIIAKKVVQYSDINLKKNIDCIESKKALEKINQLKGVKYHWNSEDTECQKNIGFIAQEVGEIVPEVIHRAEGKLTMEYDKLVPYLVEAVKELSKNKN